MCADFKAVIKQAGQARGVTDSLTVSPRVANERECGGRQLQAALRSRSAGIRGSLGKGTYWLFFFYCNEGMQIVDSHINRWLMNLFGYRVVGL